MPELPEVETIRRDLEGILAGKTIADVDVLDPRVVQGFGPDGGLRRRVAPEDFCSGLRGRKIRAVERRGKYLMIHFERGTLLAHLRMTGQLIFGAPRPEARARIQFSGVGEVLNFCDVRRFGELWWAEDWRQDPSIAALGPEPLKVALDPMSWGKALRRSRAKIQSALLDQRRIAGLGNIYVTEALFLSGIRPTRRCVRIRPAEVEPLVANIRRVLTEGTALRGVSFRDYRDARGEKGRGRDRLLVYGKAGRPCLRCRALLRGVKVNGRGTVYCPGCQS